MYINDQKETKKTFITFSTACENFRQKRQVWRGIITSRNGTQGSKFRIRISTIRPHKINSLILITARRHLESRFDICFYFVIKYKCTARPSIFRDLVFLYFVLEFLTILFCDNRMVIYGSMTFLVDIV